jgi:nitroreductase
VKSGLGLEPGDAVVGFLYFGTESGEPAAVPRPEWRDLVRELAEP